MVLCFHSLHRCLSASHASVVAKLAFCLHCFHGASPLLMRRTISCCASRYGARSFLNGWADPGEDVTVKAGKATYHTEADADGEWRIMLNPQRETSQGYSISVVGESGPAIIAKNVVAGDVIFCSGQSNMVFPVHMTTNSSSVIASADYPQYRNIRLLTVPTSPQDTPQRDVVGDMVGWLPSNSSTVTSFSAVCFQTAQRLIDLHVGSSRPVGLVFSAVGGTRVEAWMAPKALEVCTSKGHVIPPMTGNNVPSVLYNGMVAPFNYMAVRGILWYQVRLPAHLPPGQPHRCGPLEHPPLFRATMFTLPHTLLFADWTCVRVKQTPTRSKTAQRKRHTTAACWLPWWRIGETGKEWATFLLCTCSCPPLNHRRTRRADRRGVWKSALLPHS